MNGIVVLILPLQGYPVPSVCENDKERYCTCVTFVCICARFFVCPRVFISLFMCLWYSNDQRVLKFNRQYNI